MANTVGTFPMGGGVAFHSAMVRVQMSCSGVLMPRAMVSRVVFRSVAKRRAKSLSLR